MSRPLAIRGNFVCCRGILEITNCVHHSILLQCTFQKTHTLQTFLLLPNCNVLNIKIAIGMWLTTWVTCIVLITSCMQVTSVH